MQRQSVLSYPDKNGVTMHKDCLFFLTEQEYQEKCNASGNAQAFITIVEPINAQSQLVYRDCKWQVLESKIEVNGLSDIFREENT